MFQSGSTHVIEEALVLGISGGAGEGLRRGLRGRRVADERRALHEAPRALREGPERGR